MLDKKMKDKIFLALKDKKNGSMGAIYSRIRRLGTPFKTSDKRRKLSDDFIYPEDAVVSRSIYIWRLKKGWDKERAKTQPAGRQGAGHDKNIGKTVSNSVLEN